MFRIVRRPTQIQAGILAALVGAVLIVGCYPGGPESLDDIGTVITQRNPGGQHTGLMTYAMEDTVVELKKPDDDASTALDRKYDPAILGEIQDQMDKAGFRRVDPEVERPDAWVAVGAVKSDVWVYSYDWSYWGGYWGPGYYPPYYPDVELASFDQGTIIWQLLDLRGIPDPVPDDPEPVVNWLAGINGAVQNSTSTNESGIRSGIRQAFTQSPYIQAGPATP